MKALWHYLTCDACFRQMQDAAADKRVKKRKNREFEHEQKKAFRHATHKQATWPTYIEDVGRIFVTVVSVGMLFWFLAWCESQGVG